jgi:hypothetical protein
MPIRAFLDGQKFDGETIRLMGIAFEMALWSLGNIRIPGFDDPLRAALAHTIIALAEAGERDPERLCAQIAERKHCRPQARPLRVAAPVPRAATRLPRRRAA